MPQGLTFEQAQQLGFKAAGMTLEEAQQSGFKPAHDPVELTGQELADARASRKSGPEFNGVAQLGKFVEQQKTEQKYLATRGLPELALGAVTAGASLPIRMGAGAVIGGAEGGKTGAAIGAALPLGGDLLGFLAKKFPKQLFQSETIKGAPVDAAAINKWMDVPAKEVTHGANPGKRLLDENLLGATKTETQAKVKLALTNAGNQMSSKLKSATGITIDAQTPTYDAVAQASKRIGSPRDVTFQNQMNSIVDDIEGKYPNLHALTPEQAHALKVELGDAITWKGATYDSPANKAMIQIYRALNDEIKSNVPGIADLQTRWGDLHVASRNLAESMADDIVGKGTGGLTPVTPKDIINPSPAELFARAAAKHAVKAAIPLGLGAAGYELWKGH